LCFIAEEYAKKNSSRVLYFFAIFLRGYHLEGVSRKVG
jgi:hypothetical protein